jgi:hypothetical protein
VDWSANALSEGTLNLHHEAVVFQYPFCRKTSCNRILEHSLSSNDPRKAEAYDFFRFVSGSLMGEPARLGHAKLREKKTPNNAQSVKKSLFSDPHCKT